MLFKEYAYSVLIVCASEKFAAQLSSMLPENEYYPVDVASSAGAARRRLEREYDILIISSPLPDEMGVQLAMDAAVDTKRGVVLLVKNDSYIEVCDKVTDFGIFTLQKPITQSLFTQTMKLMYAVQERLRRAEEKTASLEERMQEIRLVNRAKWVLIEAMNMSEEEAHHYIEKQAMNERKSKKEIAEDIIKKYE